MNLFAFFRDKGVMTSLVFLVVLAIVTPIALVAIPGLILASWIVWLIGTVVVVVLYFRNGPQEREEFGEDSY